MDKRERDLRRSIVSECELHGAKMIDFRRTGSGHFMARVEAADGRKFALTCAFSPSSQSTIHVQQHRLRRLLNGEVR